MVGAGRFGERLEGLSGPHFQPILGSPGHVPDPQACVWGGTLSCTDALPTHRALPHFLISSLAQGLGAVRLAWGRQHQPIIRRRPRRACPWAAFPILVAPSPSLGHPSGTHTHPSSIRKCYAMALRSLWVECAAKLTGSSGTPGDPLLQA